MQRFLKMNGFLTKDPVVINTEMIIRMNRMKEEKGTVIVLSDGSKALVAHSLDDICDSLSAELCCLIIVDMTKKMEETEDESVDCGDL